MLWAKTRQAGAGEDVRAEAQLVRQHLQNRYMVHLAPLALRGCQLTCRSLKAQMASEMALSNRGIKIKALGKSSLA